MSSQAAKSSFRSKSPNRHEIMEKAMKKPSKTEKFNQNIEYKEKKTSDFTKNTKSKKSKKERKLSESSIEEFNPTGYDGEMPSISSYDKSGHNRKNSSPQIEGLAPEGEMDDFSLVKNGDTSNPPGELLDDVDEKDNNNNKTTMTSTDSGMATLVKNILNTKQTKSNTNIKSKTNPTKTKTNINTDAADTDTMGYFHDDETTENFYKNTTTDQGISMLAKNVMNDGPPGYNVSSMEQQTSQETSTLSDPSYTTDDGMRVLAQQVLRGQLEQSNTSPSSDTNDDTNTTKTSPDPITSELAKANNRMLNQLNSKIQVSQETPGSSKAIPTTSTISRGGYTKSPYSMRNNMSGISAYRSASINPTSSSYNDLALPDTSNSSNYKSMEMEPGQAGYSEPGSQPPRK